MNEDATQVLHTAMPFAATLGMRARTYTAELVELTLEWREDICTSAGILHGGAIMALADSAGAACAVLNLPEGASGTATIESKTNFFAPARAGTVLATTRPLHVGGATIVLETDVTDAVGRRVAKVIQTQAVLRPR